MKDSEKKSSGPIPAKSVQVTTAVTPGNSNPDAITGAPGSHPVGTAIGATGGAAAGAVVGMLAGPVGAVVGGVVGAVAGGLAGKGAAEIVDPTIEDTYWRTTYTTVPYFVKDGNFTYEDYGPAYRYGWESRSRHAGRKFEEIETDLASKWDSAKGSSRLVWTDAKGAVHAAWTRVSNTVERLTPGDSDHDGK